MITEDMLKNNGLLIKYIRNPTLRQRRLAIQQNPSAIKYIKQQSKGLCQLAVEGDPNTIRYLKHQYEYLVEYAVLKEPTVVRWVRRHTKHLTDLTLSLDNTLEIYIHDQTRTRFIRNRIEQEGRIVPIVSSSRFSSKEDIQKSKQLANKIYYNQHINT